MDKKLMARIFVFLSYLLGSVGLPFYLLIQFLTSITDRLLFALLAIPLGILFGLWILFAIGLIGYAVADD